MRYDGGLVRGHIRKSWYGPRLPDIVKTLDDLTLEANESSGDVNAKPCLNKNRESNNVR